MSLTLNQCLIVKRRLEISLSCSPLGKSVLERDKYYQNKIKGTNMKVLFLTNTITIAGEPMGIMQLSAIAKQRNWKSYVTQQNKDYLRTVREVEPQLIAVSMMSNVYPELREVITDIKRQHEDIPILLGGGSSNFCS